MSIFPFKPFNCVYKRLEKNISTERNSRSIMFKRDKYLNQLIRSRDNHQVKVITGIAFFLKNDTQIATNRPYSFHYMRVK